MSYVKEWKLNQKLYHMMTEEHSDALENFDIIVDRDDLVVPAIAYFTDPTDVLVYPAKSYAVALIYARMLWEHFNEPFYEVLDDPTLLFENDEYFIPYSQDPETYDDIIDAFGGYDKIPLTGKWVDYTVQYFRDECMGEAECFKM